LLAEVVEREAVAGESLGGELLSLAADIPSRTSI
jgi:hypothetical protein